MIFGTESGDTIDAVGGSHVEALGGDDLVRSSLFPDTLAGGAGNDLLQGSDGDDFLIGDEGNDTLEGFNPRDGFQVTEDIEEPSGVDLLIGGTGDDLYLAGIGDTVTDSGGHDTIHTRAGFSTAAEPSFTLPPGIEDLVLVLPRSFQVGIGNELANAMVVLGARGGGLDGGDGNDTLLGGAGGDLLEGGAGNDSVDGGRSNGAPDRMEGGPGHDRYAVHSASDLVLEFGDQGNDTVTATASCTLPAFVEDLILAGTAPLAGTGNADANRITGNAAANLLDGAGGNDTLSGGKGNDTLIGGAGADLLTGGKGGDVFRYLAPVGPPDTIKGYNGKQDGIEVSAAGFGGDLVAGMTMAAEGRFTANATGTPDGFLAQFILNTTTGLLRWDADGINDTSAVDLAVLPGAKGLTGAEILVIA